MPLKPFMKRHAALAITVDGKLPAVSMPSTAEPFSPIEVASDSKNAQATGEPDCSGIPNMGTLIEASSIFEQVDLLPNKAGEVHPVILHGVLQYCEMPPAMPSQLSVLQACVSSFDVRKRARNKIHLEHGGSVACGMCRMQFNVGNLWNVRYMQFNIGSFLLLSRGLHDLLA